MKRLFLIILLAITTIDVFAWSSPGFKPASLQEINKTMPILARSAKGIDPKVLKLALNAYNCAVLTGMNKQSVLTIVDYSKPSSQKRLWVFDLIHGKMLFNSLVAHGKGSGDLLAKRFSDKPQTYTSSIGVFLTENVYQGHNGYSLRLRGLEKGFNAHAENREIVVHGANYVNMNLAQAGRIGRSWGCPAVPIQLAKPIINSIKNGSVLFSYYPDNVWLKNSKYLHCNINTHYTVST